MSRRPCADLRRDGGLPGDQVGLGAGRSSGLSVRVREQSTRTHVVAVGELDLATVEQFDRALWWAQKHARHVVVDLCGLVFIDCTGVRSLLAGQLRASSWQRRLEVICAAGQVWRLLSLVGADQLITISAVFASPTALPTLPAPARRSTAT